MSKAQGIANSANQGQFKNRIINGAMVIDQRNAGAAINPIPASTQTFPVDRFPIYGTQASKLSAQQNAGGVTPPAGFTNYLGVTSLSAYSVVSSDIFNIYPRIEGYNIADLGWGTASAATVTLSFWVRSSLTGSFGICLQNSAQNRAYATTYTISSANTWEYKTITIAGDTSGTWLTNNLVGMSINIGLGNGSTYTAPSNNTWTSGTYFGAVGATSVVGTSGATFYITGVMLEKGSTATNYDVRPYGTELQLCQRYYERWDFVDNAYQDVALAFINSSTLVGAKLLWTVVKRAAPTLSSSAASSFRVNGSSGDSTATSVALVRSGINTFGADFGTSGRTAGGSVYINRENLASPCFIAGSAEL
jgi:hypothetical protein